MARTTPTHVKEVIDVHDSISLTAFIEEAYQLVNYIENCDAGKDDLLTDDQLRQLETNLAAHFYALKDPQYQSKATDGASGTFQGRTEIGYKATWWGQKALGMDVSGCLAALQETLESGSKPRIGMVWAGTYPTGSRFTSSS